MSKQLWIHSHERRTKSCRCCGTIVGKTPPACCEHWCDVPQAVTGQQVSYWPSETLTESVFGDLRVMEADWSPDASVWLKWDIWSSERLYIQPVFNELLLSFELFLRLLKHCFSALLSVFWTCRTCCVQVVLGLIRFFFGHIPEMWRQLHLSCKVYHQHLQISSDCQKLFISFLSEASLNGLILKVNQCWQ